MRVLKDARVGQEVKSIFREIKHGCSEEDKWESAYERGRTRQAGIREQMLREMTQQVHG